MTIMEITCPHCGKNIDASEFTKQIGSKGGINTAKNMTAEQRKERAQKAIKTRWAKHTKKGTNPL